MIEHGRDSCEYSDRQLSSFPRVCTERELFKMFEGFDFSVLIEHWLERIDLISVKLAQEVITSGIAKLQRPNKYIFVEYIEQVFDLEKSNVERIRLELTEGIFDYTWCRQRAKNYFMRNRFSLNCPMFLDVRNPPIRHFPISMVKFKKSSLKFFYV